jgi:hypothetical protein
LRGGCDDPNTLIAKGPAALERDAEPWANVVSLDAPRQHCCGSELPKRRVIVDQEWGRSLSVHAPDGSMVQIDEPDRDLYT